MLEPPLLLTFVVAQIFGLMAVVFITMASVEQYNKSSSTPLVQAETYRFQLHPMFMSIGLVYLFGCSAVIYRVLRFMEKLHAKIIHAVIHLTALALALVGLTFAIQYKDLLKVDHFTSVHGILGLITIVLFGVQWILSFPVFLWPKAPGNIRAPGLAIHVCVGVAVFISAAVTTLTGLNVVTLSKSSSDSYYKLASFFYLFYTLIILYMVTLKQYKRPPDF